MARVVQGNLLHDPDCRLVVDAIEATQVWCWVIEADAITKLDYTAACAVLVLIEQLAQQKVEMAFARVSESFLLAALRRAAKHRSQMLRLISDNARVILSHPL